MLERLYRRRMPVDEVLSAEAAKTLAQFTHEFGAHRFGHYQARSCSRRFGRRRHRAIADDSGHISRKSEIPAGSSPVRSHLKEQPLTQEDLTLLGLLRLDMIGVLAVTPKGEPGLLSLAHLNPPSAQGQLYTLLKPTLVHQCP